jgi:hypothetical protein
VHRFAAQGIARRRRRFLFDFLVGFLVGFLVWLAAVPTGGLLVALGRLARPPICTALRRRVSSGAMAAMWLA